MNISGGCNPRVTWFVDVTVDVALAKWLSHVTLIHDFHIPNVPTRPWHLSPMDCSTCHICLFRHVSLLDHGFSLHGFRSFSCLGLLVIPKWSISGRLFPPLHDQMIQENIRYPNLILDRKTSGILVNLGFLDIVSPSYIHLSSKHRIYLPPWVFPCLDLMTFVYPRTSCLWPHLSNPSTMLDQ
jgi:hypothetical protein